MTSGTCPHSRLELQALVDGALEPDRRAAVEAHLAACASCRRAHAGLAAIVAAADLARPASDAASLAETASRLQAELGAGDRRRRVRRVRLYLLVVPIVVCILGILGAVGFFNSIADPTHLPVSRPDAHRLVIDLRPLASDETHPLAVHRHDGHGGKQIFAIPSDASAFEDANVTPGESYIYLVRPASQAESRPIAYALARPELALGSLTLSFIGGTPKVAVVRVGTADGLVEHNFVVAPGESVGGIVTRDGREVDLRTPCRLESIAWDAERTRTYGDGRQERERSRAITLVQAASGNEPETRTTLWLRDPGTFESPR